MPTAYPTGNQQTQVLLSREELACLSYHSIFEYPLTMAELVRWISGSKALVVRNQLPVISQTSGFYYLGKNEGIVLKRLMRKRISARKIEIAKKAAKIISLIPFVKTVALTGALAMENASDESDIDLMVITQKGTLWTTRLFTYLVLRIISIAWPPSAVNYAVRKPREKNQKDRLCLNMWLDESDLVWHSRKRNIYSAHEIAQVRPIVDRGGAYVKFISKNGWTKEYWPNAVKIRNQESGISQAWRFALRNKGRKSRIPNSFFLIRLFEKLAFKFQYAYMKSKITNETITPTRALFHPVDWGKYVLQKLAS